MIFCIYNSIDTEEESGGYTKPGLLEMALRLSCAYLFHMMNMPDLRDALGRLKFLRNCQQKFQPKQIYIALLVILMQAFVSISCEIVNLIFLCRQESLVDLIMNYLAFAGIADLDNMYVAASGKIEAIDIMFDDDNKPIIEKLLTYAKEASLA